MKTLSEQNELTIEQLLHSLRTYLSEEGNHRAVSDIDELGHKRESGELTIAFCGHFSAGKSSLINTLCGKRVLPASPLPTSANVVMIRNGAPKVMLTKAGEEEPVLAPLEQLEEYCRNGEEYTRIAVWDQIPLLGNQGVLLDTPGVDSNDAGHALATESALHLADVVFYVMDYNHVQSETNLSFAKSLSDWGKPVYLVVNQIDKHRDQELSFDSYRRSVEQAFEVWQVKPAGIFYLSLKQQDHPHTMLPELERILAELIEHREGLLEYSLSCSAFHTAEAHLKQWVQAEEPERERLLHELGGEEEAARVENEMEVLRQQAEENETLPSRLQAELAAELDKLLGSAQLMTPPIREAAQLYLESRNPGFKIGFVFTAGKTEAEKQRRQDELYLKLTEQVSAQVDWHVRDLLRKLGQSQNLWFAGWEARLDEELPKPSLDWISGPVKAGATVSGESTLHYAADVKAGITAAYRRAAIGLAAELLAGLAPQQEAIRGELAQRRELLQTRANLAARLEALDRGAAARAAHLRALLGAPAALTPGVLPEVREPAAPPQTQAAQEAPAAAAVQAAAPAVPAAAPIRRRLDEAAALLEGAAGALAPHPAFAAGVRALTARAGELRRGRFTVALFGAFSAGKSSFANALLGHRVLPVSPHPTTAAINRILAPEGDYAHGTAVVMLKTPEAMREDLAYSFSVLQLGDWKEQSWLEVVRKLKVKDIPASGRSHYSFLQAAAMGWASYEGNLGTSLTVDIVEFSAFVAEEARACFVAGIDLYYSCPLTEQGIVLVDTPGADSIHARHTGVTFQYMKNSDALLYVTYYNHAFSRADRQFLAQLGRVKGSFALDKMFFIVNASDLASSSEELQEVVSHVDTSLRTAGIERPQIYPVSSLNALDAKLRGNQDLLSASGFEVFEGAFDSFIGNDLSGLAASSAADDLHQSVLRVQQRLSALSQSGLDRERILLHLDQERSNYEEALQELKKLDLSSEIIQEANELLFHVRQRLRLASMDLYREFFHPSLLQEDGGDLKKKFAVSLHDWTAQLSGELERELQATSLRLENKVDSLVKRECVSWAEQAGQRELGPLLYAKDLEPWTTPVIGEGLLTGKLDWRPYWNFFKNPKYFFEGAGREALRAALESPLEELVKAAVDKIQGEYAQYYCDGARLRKESASDHYMNLWLEWEKEIREIDGSGEETAALEELQRSLITTEQQLRRIY
ncbi:dynamin family protein [Paenibacillus sp. YPG26]|uniref:dynamin family protein n=1 Tax=Paenibacillus sp. YPG26 TaxID=2878915 RepID=UPI00203FD849|nr:dynamin family protein [Paenibacillus sp. YPG26]USB34833.1 dynamin family protein [Paenibacillus sp. YPG26]